MKIRAYYYAIAFAGALLGEGLVATPAHAQTSLYVPNFGSGPRIIHVRPGAANARASLPPEETIDNEEFTEAPEFEEPLAPSRRRVTPPRHFDPPTRRPYSAPRRRVDISPAPSIDDPAPEAEPMPVAPKRSVLSAPPPVHDGPSPIKPTPRWRISDKVSPPAEVAPLEVDNFGPPSAGIPADVPLPKAAPRPPTSEDLPPE